MSLGSKLDDDDLAPPSFTFPLRRAVSLQEHSPHKSFKIAAIPEFKQLKIDKIKAISESSVVQIYVDQKQEWYVQPWTKLNSNQSTGSGFIIEGRIIVTNAHVIEDGKNIQVKRQSEGDKYEARLLTEIANVDLAFITVDDEEFWTNNAPLDISTEQVQLQAQVDVVGYPVGGETVCITNGVVSRLDWHYFSHSRYSNLCITVDAAINPGNSGGPAIHEGKVVGVAFQGLDSADGIGYIIPASLLLTALREFHRITAQNSVSLPPKPISIPCFGYFDAEIMKLENPSLRSYYALPKGTSGLLITKVGPLSWLHDLLQKGDIVTKIDGYSIGFDGTVSVGDIGRMDFRSIVTGKVEGEDLHLTVFRAKRFEEITVVLGRHYELIPRRWRGPRAQYIVFAGLVFVPLSSELMESCRVKAKSLGLTYAAEAQIKHEHKWQHIVVVSTILPHRVNLNLSRSTFQLQPLLSVNGRPIHHLADLAEAIESHKAAVTGTAVAMTDESATATTNSTADFTTSDTATATATATESLGPPDEGATIDATESGTTAGGEVSDKSWMFFQFGNHLQAAFETSDALAATEEIAEEYMLKSASCVAPFEKI